MSIQASDLKIRLSVPSASSGNYAAQADPNASLGKYLSVTDVVDNTINNLFNDVSGSGNALSQVDYRCIFFYNTHSGLTAANGSVWISNQVAGGASVAIGVDPTGVVRANNGVFVQAQTATNAFTAPPAVSFSNPTAAGDLPFEWDIPASSCIGIWIRRTAANTSPVANDGATLSFAIDTL